MRIYDNEKKAYVKMNDLNNTSDDYKRGWYDGYHEAKKEQPTINIPTIAAPSLSTACKICGINFGAGPMGYVCNHQNCPTRITALSVAGSNYTPMGGAGNMVIK